MKNEIIYGQKPDMESANYIELTIKDENKLDVSIGYKGEPTVWHLIMKNPDKYEAFKAELIKAVDECEDGIQSVLSVMASQLVVLNILNLVWVLVIFAMFLKMIPI